MATEETIEVPSADENGDGTRVIESQPTKIKIYRRGNRSVVTRLDNEVTTLLEKYDRNTVVADLTAKLNSIQKNLKEKRVLLNTYNDKILESLEDDESITREIEETSFWDVRINEVLEKIDEFHKGHYSCERKSHVPERTLATEPVVTFGNSPPALAAPRFHSMLNSDANIYQPSYDRILANESTGSGLIMSPQIAASNSNVEQNVGGVKLPKINLLRFNGEITKFNAFWQSFECAIHGNSSVPKVNKLNYLLSLLEGPAYRALEGLSLQAENYDAAVELLKTRFGKKQSIINAHMNALLKLKEHPNESTDQLRKIYDKINVHVRGLDSMGMSPESYGNLLIPIIMSRMPKEIAMQVARITSEEVWNITEILEIICREIEAAEISSRIIAAEKKTEQKPAKHATGTTKAFVSKGTRRKVNCYFCDGEHYSDSCQNITDVKDRKNRLIEQRRCFVCLRQNHVSKNCKSNMRCRKCNRRHHTSICDPPKEQEREKQEGQNGQTLTTAGKEKANVLLQTATAYAFGNEKDKKIQVNILFDGGSQKSYIAEDLKKRLGLKTEKTEKINLNTFGSEKYISRICDSVKVNIEVEDEEVIPISALSFPSICSPVSSHVEIKEYPHLQGLSLANNFASDSDKDIGILIGANHYFDFVTGDIVKGSSGPVAIASKLGWLLSGPANVSGSKGEPTSACFNCHSNLVLDIFPSRDEVVDENIEIVETLKTFWQHENSGLLKDGDEKLMAETDSFKTDIRFIDCKGRYQVSLPWKNDISEPLSSHFELCKGRLLSLHSRLKQNPELLNEYDLIFKEQQTQGIIEKVVPENEMKDNIHFLSHHGVVRKDHDTTKLRIVFDGSAKTRDESVSFNDRLEIGKNYMPLLFDTLLRFRMHSVALTADIAKAFLQIEIDESDRDYLRFLWFDDIRKADPEIIQMRYNRLLFGLTCSPAILGETIRHHVAKYQAKSPKVASILNQLYADDLSCGVNDAEEAFEIYRQSKEIMSEGGFNLRKWKSNDKALLQKISEHESKLDCKGRLKTSKIAEDEQTYSQFAMGAVEDSGSKVLGVNWNSDSDQLHINLSSVVEFARSLPPTKRSVLKVAAKIYDPLGCLSLCTINMKLLFQDLCVDKVSWDDELQGDYRERYFQLLKQIEELNCVKIPRCFFEKDRPVKNIEIHGFADASEKAHACVVYLRICYESGETEVRFVTSKAKVNPIKKQSIPRLELSGACLLAKLVSTVSKLVKEELGQVELSIFYWVDSVSVLCWIQNKKPWTQYVRRRVNDILQVSERKQWFFCPGSQNPADLPSRGNFGKHLEANSFWWQGPQFLKQEYSNWPKSPTENELADNDIALKEKVKHEPNITHAMSISENDMKYIIDIERFGNKRKLLRSLAWVMRFVENLKGAVKGKTPCKEANLTAEEMQNAEHILIRSIQRQAFSAELKYLNLDKASRTNLKPPLYVVQFNLFVDEAGIIRCRSRLKHANISLSSKTPILLPAKSQYSELLIRECHEQVFHNGTVETLNLARQRYWIIRGRELTKRIVRQCIVCKKLEGLPFNSVFSPDLPPFRVDDGPPFSHVGIDFAGPLMVKNKEGNREQKVYVCLFTCASTRAVHLELVKSLEVSEFIFAFRRFSARRGLPATIISDNAKTFKSAAKEVRELWRSPRLSEYLSLRSVKWKFIVELAPWHGGMWERLIRSTKRCLKKVIGRAMLTYNELYTLLVEVEGVINSRPLTYVSDDTDGIAYPLTPAQLINGRNLNILPNESHFEIISTYERLANRAKYHRRILSEFASRWKNDYLVSLLGAYKPRDGGKGSIVNVGDIVILKNDSEKRNFWKLAKILELFQGQDGVARAAKVQVVTDKGKKVLNRSVHHLIPLEIKPSIGASAAGSADAHSCTNVDNQNNDRPTSVVSRPRRNAACIGELLRRDNVA